MKIKKIDVQIMIFLLLFTSMLSFISFADAQTEGCPSDMSHYWKLDESSSPYIDFYGGNDAICTNCPSVTSGIIGGAQQFDGTDEVIVADYNTFDWGATDSFSIEFWMKTDPASTCSGGQVIVGRDDSSTALHWWVGCQNTTGKAKFVLIDKNASNIVNLTGIKDLTDGAWHHIVASRNGTTGEVSLYVDGVRENYTIGSYTSGFDSVTAALNIGWLNSSSESEYHFEGTIDEVAIYNRALSDTEIHSHYYLTRGYCDMCTTPVRIMPLGDSITYGRNDPALEPYGSTQPNSVVGFRQPLYISLWDADYYFDFVGSLQDGELATPSFGLDHQGVLDENGFTAQEMATNVYSFLSTNPSDVVLLHIGTNDTNNTTATDIENILNKIDQYEIDNNENITVILAKIINRKTYHPYTTTLNTNVQLMAENRIASGDKIIIVDQESALDYANDMWDNLHPNNTGYGKMANAWFVALSSFLPICVESAPIITSTPITEAAMGQSYTYDVEATGNPSPTYSLITAPSDMNINSATGLIEWTPTSAGMFDVVVEATNSVGTDIQSFTIQVLTCPSDMTHYWKLDESSSPYIDFYGGNNATCTNCPIATTGIISGAQQFISTTQVNVADDNTFDWGMNDSFSIEFWMKTDPASTCSGGQVIVGRDDSSTALHWWVGCQNTTGKAKFVLIDKNASNIVNLTGIKDLTDGAWHHIVASRNGTTGEVSLYVDGVRENYTIGSYTSGFDSVTAALNIGWLNSSSEYHFVGTIDEIALYNKSLSDSEVLQHYNDGVRGYGYCTMPTYTLTVDGSGSGSGTVTGSGINCTITNSEANGDCTETYDAGTNVTLSASAASGSTFSGWSGNCSETGSCNLTMDSEKIVIAEFTLNTYALTVNLTGNGSGTVTGSGIDCTITNGIAGGDCNETYNVSNSVTLTATANDDSTFAGWSGGVCSGTGQCVITINSDVTVTAAFSLKTFSITASAPGGHGTISCTPSSVNYGGSSTCTITPDANYHLSALTDNGADVIGSVVNNQYTISNVTTNHTVTATFAIDTHTVTPSAGANGSISPSTPQTVNHGSTTSFTVTPSTGYHIDSVSGTCGGTLTGNIYTTDPITANCTVVATFAINTYTITATAGSGGSITPSGVVTVSYGGSQTFMITPDPGYHIVDVLVDGSSVGAVTTHAFTNVTTNHTISVTFAINNYTVTPSSVGNGIINPSTPQTVSHGSTTSFTVTPNTGYRTVSVTGCGGTWTGTNPYTTGSITDDCTVTATFAANTGNVNGDGNVDIVDALLIARYAAGLLVNNFIHEAADVNCDGIVNIVDALLIARKAAGLPVPNWCSN